MRDLSKANYGPRRFEKKRVITVLGGVIAVVLVVYFLNSLIGSGGSSGAITLRDAPTDLTPVAAGDGLKVDGGVNLKTETAGMKDVKYGGSAKATVTRAYGGGVYSLDIQATLPDPKNTYYQVWLVGGGVEVPVEYMSGSKTSWSLSLRDKDKFSKYRTVWITLERTKDEFPEEHVMEGSF